MKKMAVGAFCAATLATLAPAHGQRACAPHLEVVKALEEQHGETVAALFLSVQGHVTQVYVNEATGTATVVLTRPDGMACIADAGEAGQRVPAKKPARPTQEASPLPK